MATIMDLREAALRRDRERLATHTSALKGSRNRTAWHGAIHQARAGECRICDAARETRPELFTRTVTGTELHRLACGHKHQPGSLTDRQCQRIMDGWRDVSARNAARNAVTEADAWALIMALAAE